METLEEAFPVTPELFQQARQALSGHYPGLTLGPWKTPPSSRTALLACQHELEPLCDASARKWLAGSDQLLAVQLQHEGLPWEWLPLGGRALWQQRPILRLPPEEAQRPALVSSGERARVLCVSHCEPLVPDLARRLPAAEVTTLDGERASLVHLAKELNTEAYDVLVLSCWLNPGMGGLHLADGLASLERLWEVLLCTLPRVVFLGAFSTGLEYRLDLLTPLAELAQLFMRLGSEIVIGNLWPFPEWPAQVAETLHAALNGRTVLQALQRTRLQESQLKPGPWMGEWSWLCWGRGDVTLPGQASVGTRVSAIRATHLLEEEVGPEPGRRYELVLTRGRQVHIGRPGLKGVDVSLASDALENRTACLSRTKEGLVLQNLTTRADLVRVNGLPVAGECPVFAGDRLGLGDCQLLLQELSARANAGAAPHRATLRVLRWELKTPPAQSSFPLAAAVTTVGRSQECQIIVPDSSVSRVHAALKWRGESCVVSALGSNPLVINGLVLESERELEFGDTLLFSESVELVFEQG